MRFLDQEVPPLGMGCWPIGGEMYADGVPVGYANAEDAESLRTIEAALSAGLRIFDTAAAYGAGHSERLLGQALKATPDAVVITKIGVPIDEEARRYTNAPFGPADVILAIDACRRRLDRDQIDVLLLHLNKMPVEEAVPVFEQMEQAVGEGKIKAYGWSTDFSNRVQAMATRPDFKVVEHGMNVFFDAPKVQKTAHGQSLATLIRSPLAMGLLTGKYDAATRMPANDIRASGQAWIPYYTDGGVDPAYMATLNAVRELLTAEGRSLVQGALGWLWGKHTENIPVPGARTVAQIEGIAAALESGPLPPAIMEEIETLIEREPEDTPERER